MLQETTLLVQSLAHQAAFPGLFLMWCSPQEGKGLMLPTSSLLSLSGQFYLTTYLLGPLEPHIALPFFLFFF